MRLGPVLKELAPSALPLPWNRGRLKELELNIGHLTAFFLELLNDLARGQLAVGPALQIDETGPRIRAPALAAASDDE
jgi:hypothetical protein